MATRYRVTLSHSGRTNVTLQMADSPQSAASKQAHSLDRSASAEHAGSGLAKTWDGEATTHRYNVRAYGRTIGGVSVYEYPAPATD